MARFCGSSEGQFNRTAIQTDISNAAVAGVVGNSQIATPKGRVSQREGAEESVSGLRACDLCQTTITLSWMGNSRLLVLAAAQ